MGGYKSYHEYKSTDLPWVPEIPAGWHVRKLTHAISYQVGFTPESGNAEYYGDDYLWANISDLGPKVLANTSKGITEEAIVKYKKRPAKKGSLLYSFKLSVGQVSFAGQDMFTNEAIASFGGSEHVDLSYFYFLAPIAIIQNASENIYGAKILNQEAIGAAKILVPPMEEQRKIAEFLDYKTAQFDALIAKKQLLLDKLAEQRTALISQAVTKGLDPSVPMKDSGVEWMGEIPAHWDVIQIKHLTPVKRGASPRPIADPKYFDDDGDYAWVRIADVSASDGFLETTTQRLSDLGASLSVKMQPGSLFLSIAGTVGNPIITNIKCCIHDGFVYFPSLPEELKEFLYFIFLSGQPYLGLGKMGTQLNLNTDTVGSIKIAMPSTSEVNSIVDHIKNVISNYEMQKNKIEEVIQRLQEYRSALITNAVTGKIDVRDFCIPKTTEQRELAHG